jgi:glucokinase
MIAPIVAAGRTGEVWQKVSRRPGHPLVPSSAMTDPSDQRPSGPTVLAVDVGGTKLAAAVVDGDGALHARQEAPTAGADGDALFDHLCSLLDRALDASDATPEVIGVGCGGPMTRGGEQVSPLNIPQWRGFPLRARLAERYGLPAHVDNDAKALALAEGWLGAATGCADYLAMVVSTGVGGGIVCDGRLLDGRAGNAGHLGHVIVEPRGHLCGCGARGCLEAEASGTAIRNITGRPAQEAPAEVRVRTGRLVGRAVASVMNLLDVPLAVVAGSVALGFGDAFFDAANDELRRCAQLDFSVGGRIQPAGCGAQGPLLGAAAVARRAVGVPVSAVEVRA